MPNPNEKAHDNLAESTPKPGIIKKAGAVLVAAGVLGGGAAAVRANGGDNSPKKPEAVPVTTVVSTTAPENEMPPVPEAHPGRIDDGQLPGPTNEPGVPDVPGSGPGVGGSAASLEKALTPEQNTELQAKASSLATSILDVYNQGIGSHNSVRTNEATGGQVTTVVNTALDGSGFYELSVEARDGETTKVRVATYEGAYADVDNDGVADNLLPIFSYSLEKVDDTWQRTQSVAEGIDVSAAVEPGSQDPHADFARLTILMAQDGAPVAFGQAK